MTLQNIIIIKIFNFTTNGGITYSSQLKKV